MANLVRRGLTYFARLHIPRDRQKDVGRAYGAVSGIVRDRTRTLETRDRGEALRRLAPALEAMRAEVDAKLRAARLPPLAGDWTASWADRALSLRATLAASTTEPIRWDDPEGTSSRDLAIDTIREATEAVQHKRGLAAANAFWAAATGGGLTLHDAAEQWLAQEAKAKRAQTVHMHRATLGLLGDYLREHHGVPSLEVQELAGITRRIASSYITWRAATPTARTGRPPSRATIQREASTLTGLWRWAIRGGHVDFNPWLDQVAGIPKSAMAGDDENDSGKRPYTREELVALLRADGTALAPHGGGYGPALWDAIRLALLTGLRANELAALRCGDVRERCSAIIVRRGKTKNAARTVPLCPIAAHVVTQRLASLPDTAPDAPLWPEIPATGPDGRRGKLLSSRFIVARRRLLPRATGVDFHSLRRNFAEAVRNVIHDRPSLGSPELLGALMGHRERTLALRVYAPGAMTKALRRLINAMATTGLTPEVRRALEETADQRPPVVRTAPLIRRAATASSGKERSRA